MFDFRSSALVAYNTLLVFARFQVTSLLLNHALLGLGKSLVHLQESAVVAREVDVHHLPKLEFEEAVHLLNVVDILRQSLDVHRVVRSLEAVVVHLLQQAFRLPAHERECDEEQDGREHVAGHDGVKQVASVNTVRS